MNASTLTRKPGLSVRPVPVSVPVQASPAKPEQQLWKTDKEKAFEAGVRWFLAVSRSA